MPARKSDSAGTPAKKASAARKPAAKKAASAKASAKSTTARKAAAAKAAPAAPKAARKAKPARPAPVAVPGRKERRGVVVSSAMDKTIVVRIDTVRSHDRYRKVVRRTSKLHAHDEHNVANVGDVVRVVETRPLSATKHWRLLEVLTKAK